MTAWLMSACLSTVFIAAEVVSSAGQDCAGRLSELQAGLSGTHAELISITGTANQLRQEVFARNNELIFFENEIQQLTMAVRRYMDNGTGTCTSPANPSKVKLPVCSAIRSKCDERDQLPSEPIGGVKFSGAIPQRYEAEIGELEY